MMLRTTMHTDGLITVFSKLNKDVTKENAHVLCALACATPEIFFAPAMGPLSCYMAADIAAVYCKTRGHPWWGAYAKLVQDTLRQYTKEHYIDDLVLGTIFTTLDEKIADIRHSLISEGFPDFT